MKKIKKLLIPAACIAASAGAVLPLVTSCNQGSISYTDVTKGYTPKGEKHAPETLTANQAYADYKKAVKANPSIVSEDYKFFGANLVEYIKALFAEIEDIPATIKLDKLAVGLNGFVIDDKTDKVSYSNGIDAKLSAEIDLTEIIGYKLSASVELNLVNKLVNFSGLEFQHHSNRFIDNWTLIQPIWPADLTEQDWSYTFHLAGNINVKLGDYDLLNFKDIDLTHKFDYSNATLLELGVGDYTYLLDVFQLLSSFESYYLSDVTCKSHAAGPHYAEFEYDINNYYWYSEVPYTLDESNYKEDLFDYITFVSCDDYSGDIEISETNPKSATVEMQIYNGDLKYITKTGDQRITFLISYLNEGRDKSNGGIPSILTTYKWSESHTLWPRFHLNSESTQTFDRAIYGCDFSGDYVFIKDVTSTTASPVTFNIVDPTTTTTNRKIASIVEITKNGTPMAASTYTFANDIVTFANGVEFKTDDKVEVHFTYGETEFNNFKINWQLPA